MNSIQSIAAGRVVVALRFAAAAGMALTVFAEARTRPTPVPEAAVAPAPAVSYSITLNTAAITISRINPLGPSVGGPRTHPTATIVATVRPSSPNATGVMLALQDTSYPGQDARSIARWPGYYSFFGGVVSQRSTPPWTQTIRFQTTFNSVATGVHHCKIIIMNPQGNTPLAEVPLLVTVVDP